MKKVSVPSLLLMIILVAFPQISETIYTPSLPDISKALHVSNNEVQLTLSVYFARQNVASSKPFTLTP